MVDAKTSIRPRVLIADDDPEMLAMVARQMKRMDVHLYEASDGESALEIAKTERPDLVVLDVMMPGMNGWEVCRAIREDQSMNATGVIMLTGIGERLNDMNSPLYGADEYLDKPFDQIALELCVNTVLGKRNGKKV